MGTMATGAMLPLARNERGAARIIVEPSHPRFLRSGIKANVLQSCFSAPKICFDGPQTCAASSG